MKTDTNILSSDRILKQMIALCYILSIYTCQNKTPEVASPILVAEMDRKRHVGTKVDEITRGKQLRLFLKTPRWAFINCYEVLRKQELWDANYEK